MKNQPALFYVVLSLLLLLSGVPAGAQEEQPPVELELREVDAALLMEVNSGTFLWEMNSRERLYPASITKIMSFVVVLEQLEQGKISLDDVVEISANASSMGGAELFLSEGDRVTLEELLIGMAVGSANDAAVAVAEHVGGSEEAFVEMMNKKALALGMMDSQFRNPHGLHHPEHYSTAYDICLMSLELLKYPLYHRWCTIWMDEHYLQGKIKSGEVYLSNTNRMVRDYQGCDGLKTGFTREAGNGISATAVRGTTRYLAVILGCPTREVLYESAAKLLNYGFNHYKSVPVVEKGEVMAQLTVNKGFPAQLEVVCGEKLSLFMPRGENEEFVCELLLPEVIPAPLAAGEKVGELIVKYGEDKQAAVDLVVLEPAFRANPGLLFLRLLNRWLRFGR